MGGDTIGAFAFWLAIGGISLGVVLGPIGTAIGRGLEALASRLGGGGREQEAELERLARRVEELDGVDRRLLELEERLDFAERVLAQQPRPAQLDDADTPPEALPAAR